MPRWHQLLTSISRLSSILRALPNKKMNWKMLANCHIFLMRWSIDGGAKGSTSSGSISLRERLRAIGIFVCRNQEDLDDRVAGAMRQTTREQTMQRCSGATRNRIVDSATHSKQGPDLTCV